MFQKLHAAIQPAITCDKKEQNNMEANMRLTRMWMNEETKLSANGYYDKNRTHSETDFTKFKQQLVVLTDDDETYRTTTSI